jgi:ABC-type branched-subunit amino acid transport system substrate-binding protein/cytochrome c553
MKAKRNRSRALLACVLLLGASFPAIAGRDAATPEQRALAIGRGRKIYLSGVPENGAPLLASVGNAGMQVPAGLLKCANCHGRDGRGKAEGGVTPANIRWEELSRPVGVGAAGRRRPAYTSKLLIRALTTGIDAGGHRLDAAMPRYQLTHEQAADVIAYLEVLGAEADPGVTATTLKVAVLLPPASVRGGAQAIRVPLAAFVDGVNSTGGLYGRQVNLVFLATPQEVGKRAGAIRTFVEREQPFCLVASFTAGCEEELGGYLEENAIPSIGPLALYGLAEGSRPRQAFQVVAGLAGQGEALASFAAKLPELAHPKALIVRPEDDAAMREVTAGLSKRLIEAGWHEPREAAPEGVAAVEHVDAVFWFAPADGLPAFFRAAASAPPFLFAPSALAGGEFLTAPAGFAGRIFCAFPSLPSDQSAIGRKELQDLTGEATASNGSLARPALASVKLLVHGLRQAGREVSRAKLIDVLETLYSYETEQIPALTFTANRHLGAAGAHVVGVDVEQHSFILPSTWVLLRP